jgi:hypothetical protein
LASIGRNDIVLQAFPVRTDAKRCPEIMRSGPESYLSKR